MLSDELLIKSSFCGKEKKLSQFEGPFKVNLSFSFNGSHILIFLSYDPLIKFPLTRIVMHGSKSLCFFEKRTLN